MGVTLWRRSHQLALSPGNIVELVEILQLRGPGSHELLSDSEWGFAD